MNSICCSCFVLLAGLTVAYGQTRVYLGNCFVQTGLLSILIECVAGIYTIIGKSALSFSVNVKLKLCPEEDRL